MAWILTNADIVSALPILADHYEKANSGSTTELTSSRIIDLYEGDIVGATVSFTTGANAGKDAVITVYDTSTGKLTFDVLDNTVNATTVFGIVYLTYSSYVKRAYDIIENDLRNRGLDIELFLNTAQVKETHLTKTLGIICLSKRQNADSDDVYHEAYLVFSEKYLKEINTLVADYDTNEDGEISEDEEKQTSQVLLVH